MAKEDAVSIIQLDDDESCYDAEKYDSHRASIMIIDEKSRSPYGGFTPEYKFDSQNFLQKALIPHIFPMDSENESYEEILAENYSSSARI